MSQGPYEDSVRCHGTISGTQGLLDQDQLLSLLSRCPDAQVEEAQWHLCLGPLKDFGDRRTRELALPQTENPCHCPSECGMRYSCWGHSPCLAHLEALHTLVLLEF